MTDVELLATELENAEEVIDKLSAKLKERDAVLRQALAAMEGADQIDTDMRDAINQIRKVLEP